MVKGSRTFGCWAWLVGVLLVINIGVCLVVFTELAPDVWAPTASAQSSGSSSAGIGGSGISGSNGGVRNRQRSHDVDESLPRLRQRNQEPFAGLEGELAPLQPLEDVDDDLAQTWRQLLSENQAQPKQHVVEVWSKAAIGTYFQEHIMQSVIEARLNGVWYFSQAHCPHVKLNFRSGPGVIPAKVPQQTRHVVLILNGHNDEKIPGAREWLDFLPTLPQLESAGLVVLAQEDCSNHWLRPYMDDPKFKIKFAFMVYGGKDWVDGARVQQWPLGIATYRKFPRAIPYLAAVGPNPNGTIPAIRQTRRRYFCNFQATIYPGSSRETLLQVLQHSEFDRECFINARTQWLPNETPDTAAEYKQALLESEYTLAPAGLNTECYRWYEAASAGSTPIVEDVIQPPACGRDPLALMKEFNAPFIFVKDWRDLPTILEREKKKTPKQLLEQRRKLVAWYEDFKVKMKGRFCRTLTSAFFPNQ